MATKTADLAARVEQLEGMLIEALGVISGAGETLTQLAGNVTTPMGEYFERRAEEIRRDVFGPFPRTDAEFSTHPIIVETYARSYEVAAEALATQGGIGRLREIAADVRRARTIDTPVAPWYPEVTVKLDADA